MPQAALPPADSLAPNHAALPPARRRRPLAGAAARTGGTRGHPPPSWQHCAALRRSPQEDARRVAAEQRYVLQDLRGAARLSVCCSAAAGPLLAMQSAARGPYIPLLLTAPSLRLPPGRYYRTKRVRALLPRGGPAAAERSRATPATLSSPARPAVLCGEACSGRCGRAPTRARGRRRACGAGGSRGGTTARPRSSPRCSERKQQCRRTCRGV